MIPKLTPIAWTPTWRLISSRFPPTGLFDRVTSSEDLDIITDIEALTNDRLRNEVGELQLVPESDRIFGAGTTPIMAAFTHLNPAGSRFTDGSYGVYYAAKSVHTAVEETRFHRERFLAATKQAPIEIDMRSYASNINTDLHDIRGLQTREPHIYDPDPDNYSAAQSFAKKLKDIESHGIVYDSIRDPGGECIAIFRPIVLQPAVQGKHYCYVWNGARITDIYIKSEFY